MRLLILALDTCVSHVERDRQTLRIRGMQTKSLGLLSLYSADMYRIEASVT